LALGLLIQTIFLILLPLSSILLADMAVFLSLKGAQNYAIAKLVLEIGAHELRRLDRQRDKRAIRRLKKYKPVFEEFRRRFMRIQLYRFFLLLTLYMLSIAISYRAYQFLIPMKICVPFITFVGDGACYTIPVLVIVLSYILWLPFVEEPLLAVSVYRRLARAGVVGVQESASTSSKDKE